MQSKAKDVATDRGSRPVSRYIGIQNHNSLSTAWFKGIALKPIHRN